jgi:hypothetical protein
VMQSVVRLRKSVSPHASEGVVTWLRPVSEAGRTTMLGHGSRLAVT